jgi:hypothetical protein
MYGMVLTNRFSTEPHTCMQSHKILICDTDENGRELTTEQFNNHVEMVAGILRTKHHRIRTISIHGPMGPP